MGNLPIFKTLVELGLDPFVAASLIVNVVLWTTLGTLLGLFWRYVNRQWKDRDEMRAEQQEEVEKRLDECEEDREALRADLEETKLSVARLTSCQKKGCPMRLPP